MATVGMHLGRAGDREAGVACPHCRTRLREGEAVATCQSCGGVHHSGCWNSLGGCGTYACTAATTNRTGPAMAITDADLDRAVPMEHTRPSYPEPRHQPRRRLRYHPLAFIALAFALIAAVPTAVILLAEPGGTASAVMVAGTSVFGLLTIVLAAVALSAVQRNRAKGALPAGFGLGIAICDVLGVILAAAVTQFGGLVGPDGNAQIEFNGMEVPDPADWADYDPIHKQALRANVMIQSSGIWAGALGSGVIIDITDGTATILTNRHVIDPSFDGGESEPGDLGELQPEVQIVDQPSRTARVAWIAPGGIDLAVVRVSCTTNEARAAKWVTGRRAKLGGEAFAIGNPNGLGWTFTGGRVSQTRRQTIGGQRVKVIQTDVALNPGNSGGGLYDKDGFLLGINTWAQDKRVSEGLNFAIDLDSVLELLPEGVEPAEAEGRP